jgi:taurine dioxygenase
MGKAAITTAGLTIRPLEGAQFGAEVLGLDPSNISDAQRAAVWATYKARHGLVCFSFDDLLELNELHDITSIFGDKEFGPGVVNGVGKKAAPGEEHLTVEEQLEAVRAQGLDPYIVYLGNVDPKTEKPKPTDDKFFGEWEWHTDMSYVEVPPTFSLLHSRLVPETGGDTGFCNQVVAARELPADLRAHVTGRSIKHDSTYGSSGILRPGMTPPASPIEALGYAHPILRKVPSTGEEAIFLGRRTNAYVPGLPLDESEALLNELWAHATQPEFQYHHAWRPGQVVAWDNRMMLHMRHPYDDSLTRFMWRTQTKGEAVVAA